MSGLTANFLDNRRMHNRYKNFAFAGIIMLVIAGSAVAGYFLYQKYEKPAEIAAGSAQANSGNLPREWLVKYFGTDNENDARIGGPDGDPDEDILTNEQEFFFGTNPTNPDSDSDGQYDGAEVAVNLNPLGEGQLYSTEIAGSLVSNYLDSQNLQEFKKENIEKQILGILNPPDIDSLEIELPNPSSLKISQENSPAVAENYINSLKEAGGDLVTNEDVLVSALDDPSNSANPISLEEIYQIINRTREVAVPSDFLKFHQLHIAGLFAAANIFEIQKTINPLVDMEQEKTKIQEQYRNVSIIQKIDQLLREESSALEVKYKPQIEQYAQ